MAIGVTLFIVAVVVIAIWVLLEVKRLKHRILAIVLVGAILFVYFTGLYVFKDTGIDYKSIPGVMDAFKTYFTWLFSVSGNFKSITSNAVALDWTGNQTG